MKGGGGKAVRRSMKIKVLACGGKETRKKGEGGSATDHHKAGGVKKILTW